MNEATALNTAPFNMSEIWAIPINGAAAGLTAVGLDLRRGAFGSDLGRFMEHGTHREVSGNDAVMPEASGGASRKRRENVAEDDSPKGVCNAMVLFNFFPLFFFFFLELNLNLEILLSVVSLVDGDGRGIMI